MKDPEIVEVDADLLIIGGGMAGCGAAFEAAYWAKDRNLRVVIVEKAAIERSGAVAMGLSAINCYMGMKNGENQPEDFVRYVRNDLMGLSREDLVYDIARHVDSSVHMFEKWGLPFFKTEDGRYKREGRWQVMIHGESYKPIVAEAARRAIGAENVYERIFVSHLLMDREKNRVAGAMGFSVRDHKVYVFRAQAVVVAAGGATMVFRPHAVGEGLGRIWYAPWNTGSAYSLMIRAGAKMTQMEHRLVATRFKDGYGPVGMWFLLFRGRVKNAYGENYEETQAGALQDFLPYGAARPIPTPLRNHQMLLDRRAGRGPHYMRTDEALGALTEGLDPKRVREIESDGWEDFLDMTMSQALLWASLNIDPAKEPSELIMTEPYLMGSHASGTGAWVSGPPDVSPPEYHWGYNRMTTVEGLFGAGDAVGGTPHAFSSGSFTEGRLAAKAACKYIDDGKAEGIQISDAQIQRRGEEIFKPMEHYRVNRNEITAGSVNPHYINPRQGLDRLQKLMDEYCAGATVNYMTNDKLLQIGLKKLKIMEEDLEKIAAEDIHELLRAWELKHRHLTSEAVMQHTLFRKETRWPGYYYRGDAMKLDDANWHVLTVSRRNPETGEYTMEKAPCYHLVGKNE